MEGKNYRIWEIQKWQYQRFFVTIQNEMVNIFLRSFGILEGFIFSLQGFSDAFLRIWKDFFGLFKLDARFGNPWEGGGKPHQH